MVTCYRPEGNERNCENVTNDMQVKNNDYLLLLEHTVAWKPTGMDEEMLFEDSRDQVLYEAK